jgi:NAD(P)-dependent dehydrogenase (short-subunit alcohol dehydrogenase family)
VKDFRGRVAVVTGAASGIGLALCERFAAEGMRVVMADLPDAPLEAAAQKVRDAAATAQAGHTALGGDTVLVQPTDVARWSDVETLARLTRERFGGTHVVCNNAGVRTMGNLWDVTLEDWHWVVNVNLWGVIHGLKAFVPDMIARGEPGHIVNTASIVGLVGAADNGPYAASKSGVVGVSEALREELKLAGAPIGVTVLCPGRVPTNIRENSSRLRPSGTPVAARGSGRTDREVHPAEVAGMVVDAIRNDRFWLLTHPEFADKVEARTRELREAHRPR